MLVTSMAADLPVLTGRIVDASVIRRPLALRHALRGAHGSVTSRSVRLLHLVAEDGTEGIGEGSSVDWLAAAPADNTVRWFRAAAESIRRDKPAASELLQWTIEAEAPAVLRCALQTALLDVESQRRRSSFAEMLGATADSSTLPLSALLGEESPAAMAREAAALYERGLCCFKVKVGSGDLALDVARATSVRRAIGPEAGLRLDANGAWSLADAREALRALSAAEPDFVEEPLRNASEVDRLDSPVLLALDESIRTAADLDAAIARERWNFLVLKLERIGGPLPALAMSRTAVRAGLDVVFTDSIESRVGRAATVHVAAAAYSDGAGSLHALGLGGHFLLGDGVADEEAAEVHAEGPGLGVDIDAVVAGHAR
jgi:o-succinylbenzoate synthase